MRFAAMLAAAGAGAAWSSGDPCHRTVDIIFVQDASTSYYDLIREMQNNVVLLINSLVLRFTTTRFALTSFSDKPAPFRGVGNGRGASEAVDYCYKRISTSLTSNSQIISKAYSELMLTQGSGGDYPENPYEAMMYAALDTYFDSQDGNTADDVAPGKLIVVATDDVPHTKGDLQLGIDWWNGADPTDTRPHFGDPEFIETSDYYPVDTDAIYGGPSGNGANYARFLELRESGEHGDEYQRLLALLGPEKFSNALVHPGTFDAHAECEKYEYPDIEQVGNVLRKDNIMPVVLLSKPTYVSTDSAMVCEARGHPVDLDTEGYEDRFLACLEQIYTEDLTAMKLDQFVVSAAGNGKEADVYVDQLINAIDSIQSLACPFTPLPIIIVIVIIGFLAGLIALSWWLSSRGAVSDGQVFDDISLTDTSSSPDTTCSCSWDDYL